MTRLVGWLVSLAIMGLAGFGLYAFAQAYPPEGRPPRGFMLTNAPYIERVATLPRTQEFSGYDSKGEPIDLNLGYSYREFSALWMPFIAQTDHGLVLYGGSGDKISIAPVTDTDRAAMVKALGKDPTQSYSFPLIRHMWGWLSIAALVFATWFMVKRAEWKRDAAGIM